MELKDPLKNRAVSQAKPPLAVSLKPEQLFDRDSINYKLLSKFYRREGKLTKSLFMELIKKAKFYTQKEPNILRLDDPVTIIGDIHGQFYDLVTLIDEDVGGSFDQTKYLFLGDYVDRGFFGVEVVGMLMALKIRYPESVFMLRGNHQCRLMATSFNFQAQCLQKYDQEVYEAVMDFFDTLTLGAIVNNKFLCIHGGISTSIRTIEEIEKLNRFKQIPKNGSFCDLMWADPVDNDTGKLGELITYNQSRGCSYYFGYQLAQHFLKQNNLQSIIRAHQVQNDGFKAYFWGGQKEFPTVITIFSAPNYCDYYGNKGAILKFRNNQFDIQQIQEVAHPYVLPNFQDLLSWSIPFVAQNVIELWNFLIRPYQPFNQKEAVPLFLIGQQKVLEPMLKNLQKVTDEYLQKLPNNSSPSKQSDKFEDWQIKKMKVEAHEAKEKEERMVQQLANANIQIKRASVSVAINETASIESNMKFQKRKNMDGQNEKRPKDHDQFRVVLPNTCSQFEQKKNYYEQLPNTDMQ